MSVERLKVTFLITFQRFDVKEHFVLMRKEGVTNVGIWVQNWEIPYLEKVDPKHEREGDQKLEKARLRRHLCPAFTCSKWSRGSRCVAENLRDIGSTC